MFITLRKKPTRSTKPAMMDDVDARSQRSLKNFLSRSTRKKRTISFDSTVPEAESESIGASRHSSTVELRQRGVCSRAASYILRRNVSSVSDRTVIESTNHTMVTDPEGRLDDRFSSGLNRCEPSQLEQLRLKRAEIDPIVCHESDDNDEEPQPQDAGRSVILKSRLEALEVQQRLLGMDHPDVAFMMKQLRRMQSKGRFESKSGPRPLAKPLYHPQRPML
jgi:hypothetical protein